MCLSLPGNCNSKLKSNNSDRYSLPLFSARLTTLAKFQPTNDVARKHSATHANATQNTDTVIITVSINTTSYFAFINSKNKIM